MIPGESVGQTELEPKINSLNNIPAVKSSRPLSIRIIQNFHLVWLDENIDENDDDYRNSITQLRQVVNTINTFMDIDECIDFITDIPKETAFMIVSETCSQYIIPVVQDILQIKSVYIFCENQTQLGKWNNKLPKIKGVYTNITSIFEAIRKDSKVCDHNTTSISFIKQTDRVSNQNLDTLDCSFMYTQILKDILLTIDFKQEHIDQFLMYCREQFAGSITNLNTVKKIENEYYHHSSIWWYTSDSFLYVMINRALRLMDVDLIVKMGFFLRDLHQHIATLHVEQFVGQNHENSFTVYRGQGLSEADFYRLKNTQGGLLSFNNFLSVSYDRALSQAFAESNQEDPNLMGVLYEITINPSVSTTSYANVKEMSCFHEEEEILFSMHSVFRIGQVKQLNENERLWQVELTLTTDNDPQLCDLTKRIQQETSLGAKGWLRLGQLMIKLGRYDKAEELYGILLKQTTDHGEKAHLYHMLGMVNDHQGNYAKALEYNERSLEIGKKTLPTNHPNMASSYGNIGTVLENMGEYPKALEYYKKSLEIRQKTLPAIHPDLSTSYNNIGNVYKSMGKYFKALGYYEKSFEILQKTLPANHPHLATSYGNIGLVYMNLGEYSRALEYYEKSFEIDQKSIPANHPNLATSYDNIGLVYMNLGKYSKALDYYKKALDIRQKTLSGHHPYLAHSYNNIGLVYSRMGEYTKALEYYETSLKICQNILPANHPDLASSYNNIGLVYSDMGEYTKTLEYHKKSLEIRQKTFSPNHPDLANSYNSIGTVYMKMGEYSKVVDYYEKALAIWQNILPANHSDLTSSYNNIGGMYYSMGEYAKALEYYEKSLDIRQKTLPAYHPLLAISYNNIGNMYYYKRDYSKALEYYERALDIWTSLLPANHINIKSVKDSIEIVKKKL
jgi:tetratricopeptide (TPR) repeat protein